MSLADDVPARDLGRGGMRGLLDAARAHRSAGRSLVLAAVVDTEGSTYVKRGAFALFGERGLLAGALSGGCLEPEIERRARAVVESGRAARVVLDTTEPGDRVFGSGLGCRGKLDVLLLAAPPPSGGALGALLRASDESGGISLTFSLEPEALGAVVASTAGWTEAFGPDGRRIEAGDAGEPPPPAARLYVPPPVTLLLLGAGPETPAFLPIARSLGWTTVVVDHRARWSEPARRAGADEIHTVRPAEAHTALSARRFDAILFASHSIELDREHLTAWKDATAEYMALLGPAARARDLLDEAGLADSELARRLHAPAGMPLGTYGAEAVALGLAAGIERFLGEWRGR
jgi:xanthine/CO dehydrogenase XdhC/CoxF family maturation factor